MSKRVLITGGAGFIGSHLCDALAASGAELVVVDNLVSGSPDNLRECGRSVEFIEGDIRTIDYATLGRFDAVIHLAALISSRDSLSEPHDYVDVNIDGTARLIQQAAALGIPRIVFASSSTVYGSNAGSGIDEQVAPNPLSVYALTKLACEQLLHMYSELHGFNHCSLRLFNVYGPRQATNHPYANVTCKFSHAAAAGLPVQLFGDGDQTRDFIYVGDVVKCFLAVLATSRQTLYNVGTGRECRIKDLLTTLERITGRPLEVEPHPPWPNDIRRISADSRRFSDEFGFGPDTDLDEGLAQTVSFFTDALKAAAS
jgi:UDP-glucose 4-epimerase